MRIWVLTADGRFLAAFRTFRALDARVYRLERSRRLRWRPDDGVRVAPSELTTVVYAAQPTEV